MEVERLFRGSIYYRGRSGTTWSAEVLVATGTSPAVGVGPSGSPRWSFSQAAVPGSPARLAGTWTGPAFIGTGWAADVAVDGNEVAHVVYLADYYGDGYADLIYKNGSSGSFPADPVNIWNSTWDGFGFYYHESPPVVAADSAVDSGHLGLSGSSSGVIVSVTEAARDERVRVLVLRSVPAGGLFDLAARIRAATLVIAGEADIPIVEEDRALAEAIAGVHQFEVIPHAGHLFEGPGEMDRVTDLSVDWFVSHLR